MAHSRLERIGTIYSRVSGLIKTGAMKLEDRPLWYEVYQAFPPKYSPQYDRAAPDEPVRPIFYEEDVIRAKFYKEIRNANVPQLTNSVHQTLSQKCIGYCTKLQKENGLSLDEAFEEAMKSIRDEASVKHSKSEKEELDSSEKEKPVSIKEIFN